MKNLLGVVYGSPRPTFKVTEVKFVNSWFITKLTWRYRESSKRWPGITNFLCSYLWWKTCLELYVCHHDVLSRSQRSGLWIHHKHDVTLITREGKELVSPNLVCDYPSCTACLELYMGHLNLISRSQMSTLWVFIRTGRFCDNFRRKWARIIKFGVWVPHG